MTKGMSDIDADKKARIALAGILRRRDRVFSWERAFVDRVTTLYHRFYTIAEANKIHSIRGRMGK